MQNNYFHSIQITITKICVPHRRLVFLNFDHKFFTCDLQIPRYRFLFESDHQNSSTIFSRCQSLSALTPSFGISEFWPQICYLWPPNPKITIFFRIRSQLTKFINHIKSALLNIDHKCVICDLQNTQIPIFSLIWPQFSKFIHHVEPLILSF